MMLPMLRLPMQRLPRMLMNPIRWLLNLIVSLLLEPMIPFLPLRARPVFHLLLKLALLLHLSRLLHLLRQLLLMKLCI